MTRPTRTIQALFAATAVVVLAVTSQSALSRSGATVPLWEPKVGDYTYAPAAIVAPGVDVSFTCSNRTARVVEDAIVARDHLTTTDYVVLDATARAWDSKHVCDPSIVEGSYTLGGVEYRYAMFYTGSTDPLNIGYGNQIGVAYSNGLFGPWVKDPDPIVTARPISGWGVGQPSAIAVSESQVLLAYTRSDPTYMFATVLNLADAANPAVVRTEWPLPAGGTAGIFNGDIGYNAATDEMVMVLDGLPGLPAPIWLSNAVHVMRIPAADFYDGIGTWRSVKTIDEAVTGWEKHSNAGLVRSTTGTVDLLRLSVQVSIAENSDFVVDTFRVIEMWVGSSDLGPARPVIPVQGLQPAVRVNPPDPPPTP
jgi:hypothetical protein